MLADYYEPTRPECSIRSADMSGIWLSRARPFLGKVSDHEIARCFGVARTIVSKARRELGIATAPRGDYRAWVKDVRHLLGKIPDREVARRVGRSVHTIGVARRELGIARSKRRPRVRGSGKGAPIHLVNMDPPYNVRVEPRSNNAIAAGLMYSPA